MSETNKANTPPESEKKRKLAAPNSNNGMIIKNNSMVLDTSESNDVEQQPLMERSESPASIAESEGGSSSKGGAIQNAKDEMLKNGKVLGACAFYSFCSVSMVLANKSLASR